MPHSLTRSALQRALPMLLVVLALLSACANPLPSPSPTASLGPSTQQITITTPATGAVLASPFELRGQTAQFPQSGALTYRIYDAGGTQVGTGSIPVAGSQGQPGAFAALATFDAPAGGPGRLELVELSPADGAVLGTATIDISLGGRGGAPSPTAAQATAQPTSAPTAAPLPTAITQQAITIETPAPGTPVGSPMTITGRTSLWPFQGTLAYRVVNSANQQLGVGSFPVNGSPGQPATFVGQITFAVPPGGGPLRVEVYDQNAENNVVTASATLDVRVTVPQAITIETPAPGTPIGSPVVVTGRVARYPFQGNMAYRVTGANGVQLGQGLVPVTGALDQPATFVANITFNLPPTGGPVRVELSDQDAATGTVAARASIDLNVSPPAPAQQQITIDSPPRGTPVGSPMTVVGRARVFPQGGQLAFMVRDANGAMLGGGSMPAFRQPDGSATFNAALGFSLPPNGGNITVLIGEPAPGSALIGAGELIVFVNPQGPPPTAAPVQQQIFIESPPPGVLVGSPMTITGRTTRLVNNGRLYYTITTPDNQVLGDGEFPTPPRDGFAFTQQIFFQLPPRGGQISIRLYERDSGGAPTAEARIQLQVAPQIQPRTSP